MFKHLSHLPTLLLRLLEGTQTTFPQSLWDRASFGSIRLLHYLWHQNV